MGELKLRIVLIEYMHTGIVQVDTKKQTTK